MSMIDFKSQVGCMVDHGVHEVNIHPAHVPLTRAWGHVHSFSGMMLWLH